MNSRLSLCALLLALSVLTGCETGTTGSQGNLTFADLTDTVPPDNVGHVDQPIAVGARMALRVRVEESGQDADIVVARSGDEGVFTVESSSIGRVVVEAVAAGTGVLTVETASGLTDTIALSVDDIAETDILLIPWSTWFMLPDSLWADGAVLLPDAPVDLFALHRNDEGTVLTGFGAAEWTLTDGVETVLTPAEGSDFATVRSGEALEVYSVGTSVGGERALATVAEADVASLAVWDDTNEAGPYIDGEAMQIEAGQSHLLHLAAFLADGRYVVGAGEAPLEATVPADYTGILSIGLAPSAEDDSEMNRILNNGRAFFVDGGNPGVAELVVEWAGQTLTLDVTVIQAPEPE